MPIEAECANCGDVHPVGDRPRRDGTTACPRCGTAPYDTISTDRVSKPDRDRIADAVAGVPGVGPETREKIVAAFGHYPAFEAAGVDELEAVENVGPQTARRIAEAR